MKNILELKYFRSDLNKISTWEFLRGKNTPHTK